MGAYDPPQSRAATSALYAKVGKELISDIEVDT